MTVVKKITWRDRLRYAFDNTLMGGTAAIIGWLALLSIIVVLVVALIVWLGGIGPDDADPLPLSEAAWASLMRTLDPGTMGGDTGWNFRFAMLAVTLGGIFIISTFIGVLTNSIDNKLDELLKGRSRVIETGHIVILNWSEHIFTVLHELKLAAGAKRDCVVVMGDRDKVAMEDAIRERVGSGGTVRIVCRSGDALEPADLDIVSLDTARAIIVLSPDLAEGDRDAQVIKTLLAIINNPARRPAPYHIVAELRDPRHVTVTRLISMEEVELVVAGDLIARIIAQTSRHAGLSAVYTELLSYEGSEIYLADQPALVGKTYQDALFAYAHAAVIGIAKTGQPPRLNPPAATPFEVGDRVIVIADDTRDLQPAAERCPIDEQAICVQPSTPQPTDRTLIIGWNWRAPGILEQLDSYVTPGSAVMIFADAEDALAIERQTPTSLARLTVQVQVGSTTDRRLLDALAIEQYRQVILLCYDNIPPQQADSRTIVTLLHLRDIASKHDCDFSIVTEMLDVRNRRLIELMRPDDFIVSDHLVSLVLTQLAEVQELNEIFAELFDAEGMEIYIKPVSEYVKLAVGVTFATVVEAALRRGETAIGFRRQSSEIEASQQHGVVLNPRKTDIVTFGAGDRVIVIADS